MTKEDAAAKKEDARPAPEEARKSSRDPAPLCFMMQCNTAWCIIGA